MLARYELAKAMAKSAGELALSFQQSELSITTKGIQDFVTQADKQVELQIREKLQAEYPGDGFFGEESDSELKLGQGYWAVDPIDGTSNYMRKVDQWCISIAYVEQQEIQIAVVYDPIRKLMYHARRGGGAFCNEKRCMLTGAPPIDPTLILGHSRRSSLASYLDLIQLLDKKNIEHRRFGSAALGLAQVITQQTDGYFEADLNPWDCLAGLLLVEEAGGIVVCGSAMANTLENSIVAAGIKPHRELLEQMVTLCRH